MLAVLAPDGIGGSLLGAALYLAGSLTGWTAGAKILLADEPTGNPDGENSRKIMEVLSRLAREEGYCVIVVTHDPAVAEMSHCVWRMTDGVLTLENP